MNRLLRILGIIIFCIVLLIALASLIKAILIKVNSDNKEYLLDIEETLLVGEAELNLRYKTNNTDTPVLLFLHGGPGSCDRPLVMKYLSSLSDDFIIVCWDQRGAGKSYDSRQAKTYVMSIDSCIGDTKAVVEHLKKRFNKEKVYIVGHSWGSLLGVEYCQKYPSDILAYIGIGQCVDMVQNEQISYDFALSKAKKTKNEKAISQLEKIEESAKIGYVDDLQNMRIQRKWLQKFGGVKYDGENTAMFVIKEVITTDEYSIFDMPTYLRGSSYCLESLWDEILKINFIESVESLEVPVYITQGRHDYNTPYSLVEEWYNQLEAPQKELIWFEESAHMPDFEEPEKWIETVIKIKSVIDSEEQND